LFEFTKIGYALLHTHTHTHTRTHTPTIYVCIHACRTKARKKKTERAGLNKPGDSTGARETRC